MQKTLCSGKYEVHESIGLGAMAEVFKAINVPLNKPVAIKVLHPQYGRDPSFLKRFQREARAMGRLTHENIVQVFDVLEGEEEHCIIMELIEGKNLKQLLLDEGPLSITNALQIAKQIGEALVCAHQKGVLHRDIKPANILIDGRGKVKVTDFGIAAAADEGTLTQTGQALGTPYYMSPEQVNGAQVDERSDLYSLGMVIYEMLEMRHPFTGLTTTAIFRKLITDTKDIDLVFSPKIPQSVQEIVLSLVKRDVGERIANAETIVNILTEQLTQLPLSTKVPPPSTPPPLKKIEATKVINDNATLFDPRLSPQTTVSRTAAKNKRQRGLLFAIGGVASIALLMGMLYLLSSTTETIDTPPPPPPQVASIETLNEVKALQKSIRQLQADIDRAIIASDAVDAKTKSPQTYNAGVRLFEDGSDLFQKGGERIREENLDEAKRILQEANSRFKESYATIRRAVNAAEAARIATLSVPPPPVPKPIPPKKTDHAIASLPAKKPIPQPLPDESKNTPPQVTEKRNIDAHPIQPVPPASRPENNIKVDVTPIVTEKPSLEASLRPQKPVPLPLINDNSVPRNPPPIVQRKPDIELVQELLGQLKTAFENKDWGTLNRISQLPDRRRKTLQQIFGNYARIRVGIQNFHFNAGQQSGSANLSIQSLTTLRGDLAIPGENWKNSPIQVKKDQGEWRIYW